MYNILCELRERLGRDGNDESEESTNTGALIAKFFAKVLPMTTTTGYAGMSTASNDISMTILAPYFNEEVIPSYHSIVIKGVGYMVTEVTRIHNRLRIRLK